MWSSARPPASIRPGGRFSAAILVSRERGTSRAFTLAAGTVGPSSVRARFRRVRLGDRGLYERLAAPGNVLPGGTFGCAGFLLRPIIPRSPLFELPLPYRHHRLLRQQHRLRAL